MNRLWSEAEDANLLKLRDQGLTFREIAERMDRSMSAVGTRHRRLDGMKRTYDKRKRRKTSLEKEIRGDAPRRKSGCQICGSNTTGLYCEAHIHHHDPARETRPKNVRRY